MSHSQSQLQVAAPGAALIANNTISIGAAPMGGAPAGDAGGVAPSPTSTTQTAASTSSSAFPPRPEADAQGRFFCTWPGCTLRKETKGVTADGRHFFVNSTVFKKHWEIHTGEGKIICEICGDLVSRKDVLARHQKSGTCQAARNAGANGGNQPPPSGGPSAGGMPQAGPSYLDS